MSKDSDEQVPDGDAIVRNDSKVYSQNFTTKKYDVMKYITGCKDTRDVDWMSPLVQHYAMEEYGDKQALSSSPIIVDGSTVSRACDNKVVQRRRRLWVLSRHLTLVKGW